MGCEAPAEWVGVSVQAVADACEAVAGSRRLQRGQQYRDLRTLCSKLLSCHANRVICYMRSLRADNMQSQGVWNRLSPRSVGESESKSNMKQFLLMTATTFEPGLVSSQQQLRMLCS